MVLLGASYGLKVGSHIGVDALVRLLSSKGKRVVSAIACLAGLAYCGLFAWGSWVYLKKVYSIGIRLEDVPVKKWIGPQRSADRHRAHSHPAAPVAVEHLRRQGGRLPPCRRSQGKHASGQEERRCGPGGCVNDHKQPCSSSCSCSCSRACPSPLPWACPP